MTEKLAEAARAMINAWFQYGSGYKVDDAVSALSAALQDFEESKKALEALPAEHKWTTFLNASGSKQLTVCAFCGIVLRADKGNSQKPCRRPTTLLR